MKKVLLCLLSFLLVFQLTGCIHYEPLNKEEAQELIKVTLAKIDEALTNDAEEVPTWVGYSNIGTKCYEKAASSNLGKWYYFETPQYELIMKDDVAYKTMKASDKTMQVTKKEYNFNDLTFPKLVTNTEVLTAMRKILTSNDFHYSAEIYDYSGYNLTVTLDQSKVEKYQLPFNANSVTIRSTSLLKESQYNLSWAEIEFAFSEDEAITYSYFKAVSSISNDKIDNATYDPNMTFELPNHDHLLNK